MSEVLSLISPLEVNKLLESIKNTTLNNGTIYVLGNGGSASTASHFVNDLTIITMRRGINIKAISLVESIATITAVGNDDSFDNIFKTQLMNKLEKKDLVFSISASGNSSNLVNAVKFANEIGASTSSLLGFSGGILKTISKNYCLVSTEEGEYGPVEDAHMSVCHYLALNA
jgi:D-sedoheptulose 7-phosphate isomerase